MNINILNIIIEKNNINLENANIYDLYRYYIYLDKSIVKLKKELKRSIKELDYIKGGPSDIKAVDYSKVGSGGNTNPYSDINELYKKIEEVANKINDLQLNLRSLIEFRRNLEKTFRDLSKIKKHDLELKIFIGYWVEHKSLKTLSYQLTRIDDLGFKKRYSYVYLREVNSKLKHKMNEQREISQNAT